MGTKLNTAINRMASLIPNGHLLSTTLPDEMLNAVSDELDRLRAENADLRAKVNDMQNTLDHWRAAERVILGPVSETKENQ